MASLLFRQDSLLNVLKHLTLIILPKWAVMGKFLSKNSNKHHAHEANLAKFPSKRSEDAMFDVHRCVWPPVEAILRFDFKLNGYFKFSSELNSDKNGRHGKSHSWIKHVFSRCHPTTSSFLWFPPYNSKKPLSFRPLCKTPVAGPPQSLWHRLKH